MADRLQELTARGPGKVAAKKLGIPRPTRLRRHVVGDPVLDGPVLIDAAPGGDLLGPVSAVLAGFGADAFVPRRGPGQEAATAAGLPTKIWSPDGEPSRFGALILDASGISDSAGLRVLYDFFHPAARKVKPSGRVIVLGRPPREAESVSEATARRALEGFVRAFGKEVGSGSTVQLVQVAAGGEANLESTLRFLLSGRSAFVSGQRIEVGPGQITVPTDPERPLDGQVALVTGASRGIGKAIAKTLARDGAHVVCLDVPDQGEALVGVANEIGGSALQLDITSADAPDTIAAHLTDRHDGVDVVVHNAGITRDKTLGRMKPDGWDPLMNINVSSAERIDERLLEGGVLRRGGRIIGVSSMSGIAGNRGQTNYSTSKAAVIGRVEALAPLLADRPATINAVAPGFIETQMTAAMPFGTREAGRRLNSLTQGGLPVDVAETIAWFASPASAGVSGNVVRVCGQALIGA